ncbi:hypothetical protein M422DRAFT_246329 [Sphaerobolus stellatus SS14]|nr:hypothetical protein M422DRAFT_246329 [Sphaerobolus stellatus SS14]
MPPIIPTTNAFEEQNTVNPMVVSVVEGTAFRVHRHSLTKASPFFADMFSLTPRGGLSRNETFQGYTILLDIGNFDEDKIPNLCDVLRTAYKYHFENVKKERHQFLLSALPDNLDDWQESPCTAYAVKFLEPLLEYNLVYYFPGVLYSLCSFSTEDIFSKL